MLPVLIAQLVVLLKDTSLGFIVGYVELLRQARSLVEFFAPTFGNQYTFQLYVAAAMIYIIINVALSQLAKLVERRPAGTRRPSPPPRSSYPSTCRWAVAGALRRPDPSPTTAFRSGFPSRAGCATMAVSPGLVRARGTERLAFGTAYQRQETEGQPCQPQADSTVRPVGRRCGHDRDRAAADHQPAEPRARRSQGFPAVEHPPDDRSQDDRPDVPDGVVRVLHHRRPDGHADARRAGPARHAVPVAGAVQPAVHHARHASCC